jgi:hypothetical protein
MRRIGRFSVGGTTLVRAWAAALAAGAAGFLLHRSVPVLLLHPLASGAAVLGLFGVVYLAGAYVLGLDEARGVIARLAPRRRS